MPEQQANPPTGFEEWATLVLQQIGAPVTQNNLNVLNIWAQGEKPAGQLLQWNNPLNTTQQYAGADNPQNSVGVQAYPSVTVGAMATAQTLLNGRYQTIVQHLRDNVSPSGWGDTASEFSTWGTHSMPNALTGGGVAPNWSIAASGGTGGASSQGIKWSGPFGLDLSPILWGGLVLIGAAVMLGGVAILVIMAVKGVPPEVRTVTSAPGRALGKVRGRQSSSSVGSAPRLPARREGAAFGESSSRFEIRAARQRARAQAKADAAEAANERRYQQAPPQRQKSKEQIRADTVWAAFADANSKARRRKSKRQIREDKQTMAEIPF